MKLTEFKKAFKEEFELANELKGNAFKAVYRAKLKGVFFIYRASKYLGNVSIDGKGMIAAYNSKTQTSCGGVSISAAIENVIIGEKPSHYKFFQPNPSEGNKCTKGDCHIRCICAAAGITWLEAFDLLVESARKKYNPVGGVDSIGDVLEQFGFAEKKMQQVEKGGSRISVNEFAEQHTAGTYVLRLAHHVVAVKDGFYLDGWDCGNKTIYKYWEKNQ